MSISTSMTTTAPPRRGSAPATSCSSAPSRNFLQNLLDEINGTRTPFSFRDAVTAPGSRSTSTSVWVPSSQVARDASDKLRALDEARLRKRKISAGDDAATPTDSGPSEGPTSTFRRYSTQAGIQHLAPGTSIWKAPTAPATFDTFKFAGRRSPTRPSTPTMSSNTLVVQHLHVHSPPVSPGMPSKRLRVSADSDYGFPKIEPSNQSLQTIKDTTEEPQGSRGPSTPARPDPPLTPLRRHTTFSDAFSASTATNRYAAPQRTDIPSTPIPQPRASSASSPGRSPKSTPAWMRPFQLIDDSEKAIYLHRHGEGWRSHPLCLYCFRHAGTFHCITDEAGCECCGRFDALESHYWD